MKNAQTRPENRRGQSGKLFQKIYNVFYCSKKAQQQESEAENNNDSSEYNTAETDLDAVVTDTDLESQSAGGVSQEEKDLGPSERWFKAVVLSDLEEIQNLLDSKSVLVDSKDQHGWSGLHLSCWNGNPEVVQKLLEHGAQVDQGGPQGSTALALAVQKGHSDICELILKDSSCDVNHTADLGQNLKVAPLHLAVQHGHLAIVRLLIERGATVNAQMTVRGIKGVTPLHLAVESNHIDILNYLIDAGCDVNRQTQSGVDTTC